jgi:hypothetical protein
MENVPAIALKEWAVAIEALKTGKQIMLMRKGGIIEETSDFQLESKSFYLYPTYEHQKKHLLKDVYQGQLDEILEKWNTQDTSVQISTYAEVASDLEITSQQQLEKLLPYHIWTEYFAEERLKWKRVQPLHILLLRVYELVEPIELTVSPAYTGCKSWVQLQIAAPENAKLKPVLTNEAFEQQVALIKMSIS